MIVTRILGVAVGHARRRPGLTGAAFLIAVVGAGALTYIVGDTAARNAQLLQELRSPTARSILIRTQTTQPPTLFDPLATTNLAALPGVEYAVGLSPVTSATNAAIPGSQGTIGFFELTVLAGDAPFEITAGRAPSEREAIISGPGAQRLSATVPLASAIIAADTTYAVVGTYITPDHGQISQLLTSSAITVKEPNAHGYSLIALTVRQPADLAAVVQALPVLFSDLIPTDYTAEYDTRLDNIEITISKSGRQSIRSTALALTALGGIIQAIVTAVNALTQRREIARRRALGATRSMILSTLVVEAAAIGTAGAFAGSAIAAIVLNARYDTTVDLGLPVAAAIFVALTAAVAAVPGAYFGAYQDPAAVLRVP
jgi:putative ABC transport system permease protein